MIKIAELRKKSAKDLVKTLKEQQEALMAFRFNISGGKVTNTKEGRNTRRVIAQIKTLLHELEKKASV
ncbi:MAG TPA: 50S ribosomal protein L29 [Candidatus Paceibacterota bacterium]|nr:ribosomal protein [Patescibacteria group bacterium]